MGYSVKNILIIATGGTIASTDSGDGLVPAIDVKKLISYIPDISGRCNIDGISIMNIDSSNMTPSLMKKVADAIVDNYGDFDGFVVTHGTDTLGYSAAAVTYMLKGLGKPVVFTGSQLPIEHSDTDAKINLFDAVCFACENVSGVYVVFNGIVIYGTHARKIKTTSFDAFESANIEAAAKVVNGVVVYSGEFSKEKHRYIEYNKYSENDKSNNDSNDTGLYADTDMCEDIMVLKLFPGIKTDIFDYIKEHYRGVIIESFGIGGIPCTAGDEENDSNSSVAEKIGELTEAGIAVVITTQCMYEGVSLDVYEVGHILARQNVIVAKDMTTEAVTMKLMWALAHYTKMTDVKEFMEAFNVESARMATQYIVDKLGEGI